MDGQYDVKQSQTQAQMVKYECANMNSVKHSKRKLCQPAWFLALVIGRAPYMAQIADKHHAKRASEPLRDF